MGVSKLHADAMNWEGEYGQRNQGYPYQRAGGLCLNWSEQNVLIPRLAPEVGDERNREHRTRGA
jgi:hypothetical protein